jgi:hypothetical protein
MKDGESPPQLAHSRTQVEARNCSAAKLEEKEEKEIRPSWHYLERFCPRTGH